MTSCAISIMGGFRVAAGGRKIPEGAWRHRRAAELVKLLALAEGHRLHREHVMDLLWPDLGAQAAAANLRKTVHFARRTLGDDAVIGTDTDMVTLCPHGEVHVDAEQFEAAARAAVRAGDATACDQAAQLYVGDLLPEDRYASWAHERRERLRLLLIDVLKTARRRCSRVTSTDPSSTSQPPSGCTTSATPRRARPSRSNVWAR